MLSVLQACECLRNEDVLILPTDTLYGLGADAYSFNAVSKIFALKGRELSKQLPVHYSSIDMVSMDCEISLQAMQLMQKHWPGGLTIVLKKKNASKLVCVEDSVAVRVPNCCVLLDVINSFGGPLVMPSANISNSENIYTFNELVGIFNLNGIEMDDFISQKASTIVSFLSGKMEVLRKGIVQC